MVGWTRVMGRQPLFLSLQKVSGIQVLDSVSSQVTVVEVVLTSAQVCHS